MICNPSDTTTHDKNFYIADSTRYVGSNGNYTNKSSNIGLVDLQVGLYGVGLEQTFACIAPAGESSSYAYLFLDALVEGRNMAASACMRINEFHLAPAAASDPEPSSLLLASLGVLELGWRFREKLKA